MNEKKLSPKWHLIFLGFTAFVALSIYPIHHVLIAEQVVAQAERDGRVAKVVVYYSPTSLFSYLGAYAWETRMCGAKLIVRDRNGTTLFSKELTHSISYDLPSDIEARLAWEGDVLTLTWNEAPYGGAFLFRP